MAPPPISSSPVSTTATQSSILQTQAEQRNRLLDEYFESTKLLEVVKGFMTNLATTYKVQLRLPANPYPELLRTIRMHELRQAFALESSNSASLDLTAVAGQASTLSQFQVCSVQHEQFVLPIWGTKAALERLTGANLYCLLEQVNSALQGLLWYKEFTDDDCRTTAYSALVGDCILGTRLLALPCCFFQLETHVFVSGVHLEKTMAVFARFLHKQLHEAANAAMTFTALSPQEAADYCGCVLCDGITVTPLTPSPGTELGLDNSEPTVWTIERLKESRTAFLTAIKTALVSNARITLKRFESAKLPGSGSFLCKVEQDFFFHFIMEAIKPADSKNVKSTTSRRSFIVGSRAEAGIFFHAQGAVEIAARFRAEAQAALEEEERKKQSLKKKKQAAATVTQRITEKNPVRPGFVAVLQETIGALHRMGLNNEVFRQQTHRFVGCFAYTLGYLVGAHEVLVEVLCHPECTTTIIPVIHAAFASLTMWMERFMEESSVCPPTSVLHPVHHFLLSSYRLAQAASALEDERQVHEFVEALRSVNELLLIVIHLAFNDFLGLVATTSTEIQAEKNTTEVDEINVLRALEMALEERKYPASIVSEAVFAQAVIDSCLDVALESAVMNTVAVRLPPNPFIEMSNNLQVFALRQLVWRYELLPTRPKGITKIVKLGSLELFSVEGSSVCAVNPRLLELGNGDQVLGIQQWLMDHRIFFQGTYKPPKSSYSVAILPMLLIFHPLLFAMPTSDKDHVLLRHVSTMEHYILEGTESAQARSFFIKAVQLDMRRLGIACGSPATGAGTRVLGVTAQALDPHGHVEASLDLSPSTADEMLATFIEEGAQADLLLQVFIQVAEVEPSGDSDILTIHTVTKTYAHHHHSTDADSTTLLSPMASFRVLEYGIFFSKENALLCLKNLSSGGCPLEGSEIRKDEWTPYASEAFQHNDQFVLYELDILHTSTNCTSPRQHRDCELATRLIAHSGICQLYSLEQAVRWLLDALQAKLQRLTSSKSRKGEIAFELPRTTTFSLHHRLALQIISQMDWFVIPLNNQLQFLHDISSALATIRNCVTRWQAIQPPTEDQLGLQRKQQEKVLLATPRDDPTAVIRDLVDSLRVTWMLVRFFRFSYQHAFFANANRKRGS